MCSPPRFNYWMPQVKLGIARLPCGTIRAGPQLCFFFFGRMISLERWKVTMSKQLGTVWPLEPHTAKKHEILRRYFQAWLPIMVRWNKRVLFIDGFAGPGEYSDGEDGSPVIVLKEARDHTRKFEAELVCLFVEADQPRYEHLR